MGERKGGRRGEGGEKVGALRREGGEEEGGDAGGRGGGEGGRERRYGEAERSERVGRMEGTYTMH